MAVAIHRRSQSFYKRGPNGGYNRIVIPPYASPGSVAPHIQHEAARLIALRLRILADGPFCHPETWHWVAVNRYGLRVEYYDVAGGERGEYAGHVHPRSRHAWKYTGTIAINLAYPYVEQAKAWVHELAHHLMAIWQPGQLVGGADLVCYYDDHRDSVHHRIARRVERLVIR